MRDLHQLDHWRVRTPQILERFGSYGDGGTGVFEIMHMSYRFFCVASDGGGWDHVSVSLSNRTPIWREMEFVKRTFFKPEEAAMQLHVPITDHINCHPFCLHLWRPQGIDIPMPPKGFV